MGDADSRSAMEGAGARLVLSSDPVMLMPGLATTGYVPRLTDFEAAGTELRTLDEVGREVVDPMDDDISVVAAVGNEGLVIATGCSHAGIVNIVVRAKELTAVDRVAGIVGGLHLVEATMERIRKTVDALSGLEPAMVCAGHCTGFDAQVELRAVFGSRFQPLRTGQRLLFGEGAPGREASRMKPVSS
jgi:7,8-dihydropterin-6-yl-methyl-4-(beta-D-ribofuranosyl)aminobenzene 5'-phosphate synthase